MKTSHIACIAAALMAGHWVSSSLTAADAGKKGKRAQTPAPPSTPNPDAPRLVPPELFMLEDPKLEVTVWATSPLLHNPANMDFDAQGRLWVTQGVNYRRHEGRDPNGDRLVVLEDTDGDGRADKSWTFVQDKEFVAPLGVAVFDNVIVVSQPPNMIVYTDVNRDAKFDPAVDKREILLYGFNGRNHDHSLHSVTGGPDGLWYWNQGNTGAKFTDKSGKTFQIGSPYKGGGGTFFEDPTTYAGKRSDDGHVWVSGFAARMHPDGTKVEIIGHGFRNSYEQCVTSFGEVFQNDNDDPPACRVTYLQEYGFLGFCSADGQRAWRGDKRPGQSTQVAEWRQEDPNTIPAGDVYGGGAPTGIVFYENGALGSKYQGMLLSCETGRNTVFGYFPKATGAGYELNRFSFMTSNPRGEFGGSDFIGGNNTAKPANESLFTQFRPSDVIVGPDGAIYVADWFDPRTGGHTDLDETTSGTIYRIAPKGFKPSVPKIDLGSVDGAIAALKSPAVNVRWTGFNALKARGESALPAVRKVLKDSNPYIAARAIWLLPHLGPQGVKAAEDLLKDKDERVRVAALRALRRVNGDVLGYAQRLVHDKSPAVRRDVALALRNLPYAQTKDTLLTLARNYTGNDPWLSAAIRSAVEGHEPAFYTELVNAVDPGEPSRWPKGFSELAWRLHVPQAAPGMIARALDSGLPPSERKAAVVALAFIGNREAVHGIVETAAKADGVTKAEAIWWLLNRKDSDWKNMALDNVLKQRGIYDPDSVEITASTMPESTGEAPKAEAVAALKGNAVRGKETFAGRCLMCHRVGSEGNEVGPDLSLFGRQQPAEVIVQSIINPSAEIAHGYDADVVTLKGGQQIEGIVLTDGNPLVTLSAGGLVQMVPRKLVAGKKGLGRSLMWTPQALGLTAQDVADIVAYMKSL